MSKVGKQPVVLPKGVEASISGDTISIKGPRGSLSHTIGSGVQVKQEGENLVVELVGKDKQARANYGTVRSLLNNMAIGVSQGWKKSLELNGVGYTAELAGDMLTLSLGYSHKVNFAIPKEVSCSAKKTAIELESNDKQLVGNLAAQIRLSCPPEPYLGKGVRYSGEQVRRKAGKAGVT